MCEKTLTDNMQRITDFVYFTELKRKNKIDKLSKTNGEKINMWISCGYILISLHYMEAGEAVEAAHYIFIISRKLSLMSLNLMIRVLRNTVKKKRYMRQ